MKTLYLVIEVVSKSSTRTDRTIKRELYQEQGIPTYWVVDFNLRQVEVWTPEATAPPIERKLLRWRHPDAETECVIDLAEFFEIGPRS